MTLTEHELLFIHDKADSILPYYRALIKRDGSDKFVKREIGRMQRLKAKCKKELISKFNYSNEFLTNRGQQ